MSDRKTFLIVVVLFMIVRTIIGLLFNTNNLFLAIVRAFGGLMGPLLISLLIYAFIRKGFYKILTVAIIIIGSMATAGAFIEAGWWQHGKI